MGNTENPLLIICGTVIVTSRNLVLIIVFLHALQIVFRYFFVFSLGDGIKATRAEGMTAQYAPHGKTEADKKATFDKCLKGIGGTGRVKPTSRSSF